MEWTIAEAEERFDELLDRVEQEGPQRVERGGKHFLVVVAEEQKKEENPFIRALLDEPEFVDIGIERINPPLRDIEP